MASLSRQTVGRRNRQTTVKQYAPDLLMREHKNLDWFKLQAFAVEKRDISQTISIFLVEIRVKVKMPISSIFFISRNVFG